jgi:competence protein ComEC
MRITKRDYVILCILICIGFVRYFFFLPKSPQWESMIGKKVKIDGLVTEPPDVRLNNQQITFTPNNQASNILLSIPITFDITYGDRVEVIGILDTPKNFLTSSGKEFNYERYLANQDIYFSIKNPDIEIISHDNGSIVKSYLYKLRDSFMKNIGAVISPPESDLADGLILGARGGFDNTMRDEFITTGTIHMIALSGYNVTIVAENVMKVFGMVFSETIAIVFGIGVVFLFIVMAGASSTAVRAGIMATIALLGRMTGRKYNAGRALVIAALLMLAYDIRILSDISFQLSFLATFGVLFVTPLVIPWVVFIPLRFKLRETAATTIAATITVLPLLLYSTGILSLVSFPANMLILPLIPCIMFLSFLVGIVGYLSSGLALVVGYVAHMFLAYILMVIHFFAHVPFASVTIESFPLIITIGLYGLLGFWVWRKDRQVSKKE